MSRIVFLFSLIICINSSLLAQVIEDNTDALGVAVFNGSMLYGAGASFYDVNEDGWDDLTICIPGAPTRFYLNVLGQFQLHSSFDNIYDSKSCLWADYDEDGDNDLLLFAEMVPCNCLSKQTVSFLFKVPRC